MKHSDKNSGNNKFSFTPAIFIFMTILFLSGAVFGIISAFSSVMRELPVFNFISQGVLFDSTFIFKAVYLFFIAFFLSDCSFLAPVIIPALTFISGSGLSFIISGSFAGASDKTGGIILSLLPILIIAVPVFLIAASEAFSFWCSLIVKSLRNEKFEFGSKLSANITLVIISFVVFIAATYAYSKISMFF